MRKYEQITNYYAYKGLVVTRYVIYKHLIHWEF